MIAVGTVVMRSGPAAHAYALTAFLKRFHAVTLHAVLALPALAQVLEVVTPDEPARLSAVRAATLTYAAAAVALLVVEIPGA